MSFLSASLRDLSIQAPAMALAEAATARDATELAAILAALQEASAIVLEVLADLRNNAYNTAQESMHEQTDVDDEIGWLSEIERQFAAYHPRLLRTADRLLEDAHARPWSIDAVRRIVTQAINNNAEMLETLRDLRWKLMAHRADRLPIDLAAEVSSADGIAALFRSAAR